MPQGGTIFWDASGDGKTWAALASVAAPFSVTTMMVAIGGGTYQAEASPPGTASFDDVNLPPP